MNCAKMELDKQIFNSIRIYKHIHHISDIIENGEISHDFYDYKTIFSSQRHWPSPTIPRTWDHKWRHLSRRLTPMLRPFQNLYLRPFILPLRLLLLVILILLHYYYHYQYQILFLLLRSGLPILLL